MIFRDYLADTGALTSDPLLNLLFVFCNSPLDHFTVALQNYFSKKVAIIFCNLGELHTHTKGWSVSTLIKDFVPDHFASDVYWLVARNFDDHTKATLRDWHLATGDKRPGRTNIFCLSLTFVLRGE